MLYNRVKISDLRPLVDDELLKMSVLVNVDRGWRRSTARETRRGRLARDQYCNGYRTPTWRNQQMRRTRHLNMGTRSTGRSPCLTSRTAPDRSRLPPRPSSQIWDVEDRQYGIRSKPQGCGSAPIVPSAASFAAMSTSQPRYVRHGRSTLRLACLPTARSPVDRNDAQSREELEDRLYSSPRKFLLTTAPESGSNQEKYPCQTTGRVKTSKHYYSSSVRSDKVCPSAISVFELAEVAASPRSSRAIRRCSAARSPFRMSIRNVVSRITSRFPRRRTRQRSGHRLGLVPASVPRHDRVAKSSGPLVGEDSP